MLEGFLDDPLCLGLAQAALAFLLAIAVMLVARWQEVHLERETLGGKP